VALGVSIYQDKTHLDLPTLAARNLLPGSKRQWGMVVTVYADPTPANNKDYQLVYNLNSTTKVDNLNWQTYAPSGGGGGSGIPVTDDYADVTALLADQANQTTGNWYRVLDANDDDDVDAGWAIYEYLGTTTGTLADYYLITDQEGLSLLVPGTLNIGASALRNCGSTPVVLISAPGAGKFPAIDRIIASYKAGAVAFDFTSELVFKTVGGDVQFLLSGELNSLTSKNFDLIKQGQRQIANAAYVLTTTDGTDATVGDGDLDIKMYYTIENVNT
jgi:hypothetical protein